MDNSIEDALAKSKNEFVEPKPAKIAKIDSIEVQNDNLIQTKQCDFCPESFETQENLTDHVISSHCKITCKVCDEEFPQSLALKKHYTYEHAVKNVKCKSCDMEFSTKDLLSKHHETVCSNTQIQKCHFCRTIFVGSSACAKTVHMKTCKKNPEKLAKYVSGHVSFCVICKKTFESLKRHLTLMKAPF